MKRIILAFILVVMAVSFAFAEPSGKVMMYSSMQEDQLVAIKKGFEAKYPGVTMDYYFAGTGRVITKIATEHQAGQVAADIIWVGDPSDYLSFKEEGILEKYSSPEAAAIDAKFIDVDGFYTGARMMNMGIGYNSALVTPEEAPKSWNDLLDPKWEGQIVMTDPTSAGTTKYFVAALLASPEYGEEYFKKLKANGCELESGTTATHNQVAASAYKVGVMLDYVSHNLMAQGSPIGFTYLPKDLISIFSPIGLVKGCANMENGKLLYDFILSKEGQEILVANNLLSVRNDVDQKGVNVEEIAKSAMTVDLETLAKNSDKILSTFDDIFKK
ncbi:MAG: ABC transporter substrate-binding protein [Synergistaceae bacterium]|nr:ABC transporter substrate-binding protein [Synergistaceae bacterium]MBR0074466.1 ABC transporter substrate-binding protein [Synergistaceae bacterium]MBR0252520.1 ABC transporter substrate-binding protein [Synergistaceae bacterium]MBR0317179.1 ABC transporter substrate-binding protein [Synergistaceae bacterium]